MSKAHFATLVAMTLKLASNEAENLKKFKAYFETFFNAKRFYKRGDS